MKPDQERVRNLLMDTVTLLCKNGLQYKKELRVQGLLGITLDDADVFVVHINEKFGDLLDGTISLEKKNDRANFERSAPAKTLCCKVKEKEVIIVDLNTSERVNLNRSVAQRPRMTRDVTSTHPLREVGKKARLRDEEQSCTQLTSGNVKPESGQKDVDTDDDGATTLDTTIELVPQSLGECDVKVKLERSPTIAGDSPTTPYVAYNDWHKTGTHDATDSTWDASQISAHNSGYAADGQSLTVNSAVAGCSSWDPSQAAAAARQAVSGTEQGADSVGFKSLVLPLPLETSAHLFCTQNKAQIRQVRNPY